MDSKCRPWGDMVAETHGVLTVGSQESVRRETRRLVKGEVLLHDILVIRSQHERTVGDPHATITG